ncbi:MAG: potassium channel protein [Actinomycetota bacterium]|nr:potassium channel protein [Actinomycetota bacterium]
MNPLRRIQFGLLALLFVIVGGTAGYVVLGFTFLEALYQTVTTITTVGFREVRPLGAAGQVFTIVLILVGVGTALYTFGVLLESLIEGHLRDVIGRRRMDRTIAGMSGHVIICGWGRVGRATARYVTGAGGEVIVIDRSEARLANVPHPTIHGDVTDDDVLRRAGIERAKALVAALETDSDNLYVTLSGRVLNPDLTIIARARTDSSEAKLERAGANRVVNPQRLGGDRMAAFATQPHVVEFLEVVMHDGSLEFRLEEVVVAAGSALDGRSIREAHIRDTTGALLLALRDGGGFLTNPPPETVIRPDQILIAIGTEEQLAALLAAAGKAG